MFTLFHALDTFTLFKIFTVGIFFILWFLFYFFSKTCLLVHQAEVVIIERFGKFNRILQPGLHWIAPFIDSPRSVTWTFVKEEKKNHYVRHDKTLYRIDLREAVYDFPKQNVITKDNVTMEINALLYYQINNPHFAVYEVFNLPEAIEKLTQTTLRNVIGSMDLDETLVSRDDINTRLCIILDQATDKWGVKVNRVELQEVNPPADIRHAMEKQMRAERERREKILLSEGAKQAAILEAEGERESQILRAKGDAESRVIRSEGEATAKLNTAASELKAIELIKQAIPQEQLVSYMIGMQYIKTLPLITEGKEGKTVVIPYEATSLAGSLSTIQKLFENK